MIRLLKIQVKGVLMYFMSGEQIAQHNQVNVVNQKRQESTFNNENLITENNKEKTTKRADINILMSKVRSEKKKQNKENLVFFGLIASVIVITGIIASL